MISGLVRAYKVIMKLYEPERVPIWSIFVSMLNQDKAENILIKKYFFL